MVFQGLTTAVLLNLFDVAAHFSPRLWFWTHFTKNLFQNSWLGAIIALSRNISRPTWRSFAAHRLRSAELEPAMLNEPGWYYRKSLNESVIDSLVLDWQNSFAFRLSKSVSAILCCINLWSLPRFALASPESIRFGRVLFWKPNSCFRLREFTSVSKTGLLYAGLDVGDRCFERMSITRS